jgi:hypothetical protein
MTVRSDRILNRPASASNRLLISRLMSHTAAGSLADHLRETLGLACEAILPVFNDIVLVPGVVSNQTTDGMRGEVCAWHSLLFIHCS